MSEFAGLLSGLSALDVEQLWAVQQAWLAVMVGRDVSAFTADEVVMSLHEQERHRRSMAALDHHLIAGLSEHIGTGAIPSRNARDFLVEALRVHPGEASARVAASVDLGPRPNISGPRLGPLFPATAAAQAAGDISERHSVIIRKTITGLPAAVEAEHGAQAEQVLVRAARVLNPAQLGQVANRIIAHLHPDGLQPSEADHHRHRTLSLRRNDDRSADLIGHLTPELATLTETVLDVLSQPKAGEDGFADTRTAGQRRHDALFEVLQRIRRGGLPEQGGVPTTIYITTTAEQFQTGIGLATTSKGDQLTIPEAMNLAGEAIVYSVPIDDHGFPLDLGRTARYAPAYQRHALAVRDKGCTFPGCTYPPPWTADGLRPPEALCRKRQGAIQSARTRQAAGGTTIISSVWAGPSPCPTASPPGSPRPGATRSRNPSATTPTTRPSNSTPSSSTRPRTASTTREASTLRSKSRTDPATPTELDYPRPNELTGMNGPRRKNPM
jgi:Domain of unknown function (DUF222)